MRLLRNSLIIHFRRSIKVWLFMDQSTFKLDSEVTMKHTDTNFEICSMGLFCVELAIAKYEEFKLYIFLKKVNSSISGLCNKILITRPRAIFPIKHIRYI